MDKTFVMLVHQLEWRNIYYKVKAESEEEARELVENEGGEVISEDFDCIEQMDIKDIIETNED